MAKEHGLQVQKVAAGAVQLGKGVFGFSGGSCLIDDDEKVAHAVVEVEHLDQGVAVGERGWFRRDDDQTYGGQGRKGLHGLGDARALVHEHIVVVVQHGFQAGKEQVAGVGLQVGEFRHA